MKTFKKKSAALILAVTLLAVNPAVNARAASFTDVKNSDWFYGTVTSLADRGVINGYPDGRYKPQNAVTYAEFLTLLNNKVSGAAQNIPGAQWYEGTFRNLRSYGVIDNIDNPNGLINREEAAYYLSRSMINVLGLEFKEKLVFYSDDADIDPAKQDSIMNTASYGIMVGDPSGAFRPKATLTRAEAAQIIYNLDINSSNGNNGTEKNVQITPPHDEGKIYNDMKELKQAITDNVLNKTEKFSIRVKKDVIKGNIHYLYANLDSRIAKSIRYSIKGTGDPMNIYFYYKDSDGIDSFEKDQEFIKSWVAQNISSSMSDEEKVKAIHGFIVNKNDYNMKAYRNSSDVESHGYSIYTPSAILFGDGGVCSAYAVLFQSMAEESGLECIEVSGTAHSSLGSGGHAWNMVKVDGTWYHIDTTWDDPVSSTSMLTYNYYLKSDSYMRKDHAWDESLYPSCPQDYSQHYGYDFNSDQNVYIDNYNNNINEFDADKQNNELNNDENQRKSDRDEINNNDRSKTDDSITQDSSSDSQNTDGSSNERSQSGDSSDNSSTEY